jgi:hypothetical protein
MFKLLLRSTLQSWTRRSASGHRTDLCVQADLSTEQTFLRYYASSYSGLYQSSLGLDLLELSC